MNRENKEFPWANPSDYCQGYADAWFRELVSQSQKDSVKGECGYYDYSDYDCFMRAVLTVTRTVEGLSYEEVMKYALSYLPQASNGAS